MTCQNVESGGEKGKVRGSKSIKPDKERRTVEAGRTALDTSEGQGPYFPVLHFLGNGARREEVAGKKWLQMLGGHLDKKIKDLRANLKYLKVFHENKKPENCCLENFQYRTRTKVRNCREETDLTLM